jgi:hypothetical protein
MGQAIHNLIINEIIVTFKCRRLAHKQTHPGGPMRNRRNQNHHDIHCQCGKTLRIKISEEDYGTEKDIACLNCGMGYHVTIPAYSTQKSDLTADKLERLKPYFELLLEKVQTAMTRIDDDPEVKEMKKFFEEEGVKVRTVLNVDVWLQNQTNTVPTKKDLTPFDIKFLRGLKVSRD